MFPIALAHGTTNSRIITYSDTAILLWDHKSRVGIIHFSAYI